MPNFFILLGLFKPVIKFISLIVQIYTNFVLVCVYWGCFIYNAQYLILDTLNFQPQFIRPEIGLVAIFVHFSSVKFIWVLTIITFLDKITLKKILFGKFWSLTVLVFNFIALTIIMLKSNFDYQVMTNNWEWDFWYFCGAIFISFFLFIIGVKKGEKEKGQKPDLIDTIFLWDLDIKRMAEERVKANDEELEDLGEEENG